MLSEGTRAALAACLYDAGFTGVARLIAEGTTDVFEATAAEVYQLSADAVSEAAVAAERTKRAQLVLVTPDGEGEWLKPELVGTIAHSLAHKVRTTEMELGATPDPFEDIRVEPFTGRTGRKPGR